MLDADHGKENIFDVFKKHYENAGCCYSTHKHTTEAPRLRLVIPLDRPVRPDEYQAIAHRIAGVLGIENFDVTTFQVSRLMYWPSTSKDGKFLFDWQDGRWLCADKVLSSYTNWKDVSEWPVNERAWDTVTRSIKKAGEPTEKPGMIGLFCRVYGIAEAIEKYLPDVYEKVSGTDDRYTYREGTTSGGLIIYAANKFAYSHHESDPISGKLCNAFDLVRIHLFGEKDQGKGENVPVNKLSSSLLMNNLCTKDEAVKIQLGQDTLTKAREDFGYEDQNMLVDQDGLIVAKWTAEMDINNKGDYHSTINNTALILQHDPELKERFATDEFKGCKMVLKSPPWASVPVAGRLLKDEDVQNLFKFLRKNMESPAEQIFKTPLTYTWRQTVFTRSGTICKHKSGAGKRELKLC